MQPRFLNLPFGLSIYLGLRRNRRVNYTRLWKRLYLRETSDV